MNDAAAIERWAEAVHIRWMRTKQAQGYPDHPFQGENENWPCDVPKCGRSEAVHHHCMVPFGALTWPIQDLDRQSVRAVIEAIEADGYQIVRPATASDENEPACR